VDGGDIFYKRTPLSNISFGPGRGAPFINATPLVNNASGPKDPVTADQGLVLVAVAHGRKQYVHGEMRLAGDSPPVDPAPSVTSTTPAASARDVPVSVDVTATFSEIVQGVTSDTFFLTGPNGVRVPATVSGSETRWTLDPAADLAAATDYRVDLVGSPTGIRDSTGNPLSPTPTTFTFSTAAASGGGDGVPPTVTLGTPAPGATAVTLGANANVTFSEPVSGVDPTTFLLVDTVSGSAVDATVRPRNAKTWILDPVAKLAPDRRYRLTLVGGATMIRDTSGTPFATTSWEFVTGPAPKVSSRTPKPGATGVSRSANVTVRFNEPMQNVTGVTFTLTDPNGAAVAGAVAPGSLSNSWVLDPEGTLGAGTVYTVTLTGGATGITDLAGNPLTSLSWSFTTGG
jgi:hypothetical protein